ncbi:Guanine nucleotide-binding protein subunit alpha homolog [Gryllus bimaculatus]|nr:Guanine nucleotide-binding protein subunit alpha homolog [Gryllus bimaculatus]
MRRGRVSAAPSSHGVDEEEKRIRKRKGELSPVFQIDWAGAPPSLRSGARRKMATVLRSCSCCLQFKLSPEEIEQRHKSQEIDRLLEKEKQALRRQVKLLLLGAGESGKSTFLKQMRIIHGVKFEPELLKEYQHIIYQNVLRGMKVLVDARNKLNIPWGNLSNADYGHEVMKSDNSAMLDARLFVNYAPLIRSLWQDTGIRRAFERRREFQMIDSLPYFCENLERIARTDYVPNHQDILHARKATEGVSEVVVHINDIPFRFVDVGGQRSQRQKWVQCFDSVTSILFLVSSSEYDQVIWEDKTTNRLEESRTIFATIVNNMVFREVSIILFINKTDLLAQKLQSGESDIRTFFPQFEGSSWNLADVQKFILSLFLVLKRDPRRVLFHHFTTAVDTENIKLVFNAVKDTILFRNLESLMLQ